MRGSRHNPAHAHASCAALRAVKAYGEAICCTCTLLCPWLRRRHRRQIPDFTTSTLSVPATIFDSRQQEDLRERAHDHVILCSLATDTAWVYAHTFAVVGLHEIRVDTNHTIVPTCLIISNFT